MEKITRKDIISKLHSGVDDIMADPILVRGFNLGNGVWMYLWLDSLGENPDKPYSIPGQAVIASLREMDFDVQGHPDKLKLYNSSNPIFLECDEDIQKAGTYFSQVLGIVE